MTEWPNARRVFKLVRGCSLLFAGEDRTVQGAALADMLARWLAGHVVFGDPKATAVLREEILRIHLETVRKLVPVNYKDIIEPELKRRTQ